MTTIAPHPAPPSVGSRYRRAFDLLERRIYDAWVELGRDEQTFAPAATEGLRRTPEVFRVDVARMLGWAINDAEELPSQNWDQDFGQPTITVVANDDFQVDLLYWTEHSSTIHNHASCGAFAALRGRRVHAVYEYGGGTPLDDHTWVGTVTRRSVELMHPGDAHPVLPDLVHALAWIEKPSVTINIRCREHRAPVLGPREYWQSGLEVEQKVHHSSSLVSRQLDGLDLLRRSSPGFYLEQLAQVLECGTPILAYHAIERAVLARVEGVEDLLAASSRSISDVLAATLGLMRRREVLNTAAALSDDGEMLRAILGMGLDGRDMRGVIGAEFGDTDAAAWLARVGTELSTAIPRSSGLVSDALSLLGGAPSS